MALKNTNKGYYYKDKETHRRRGKINQGLIILTGLVLLLGAVVIYLYIIRGVYGNFTAEELVPDTKILKNVVLGAEPKVGILYSRYTENMLPEGSTWLNDNINTWEKFLANTKLGYKLLSDRDIEEGNHFNYEILVLPGSFSLSDREIIQIKKFIDNGGSIYATSGTASFSNNGKWRGWEFFSEVFGLKFSYEIKDHDKTKIHTLRGGLPLTANIPTGYPLKIATWDRPIAAEVLDPRTTQLSFWYNYRLDGGLVREGIKESAGIAYGTYGSGRFVWMGFEINSVIGVQEDYIYFERLFKNCLDWLTYKPIGFLKDWPNGYDAAAIIAPTLGDSVENIENLLPILSRQNLLATFFVQPEKAKNYKNLLQTVSNYGEIAALVDIGYLNSVDDTVNSLYSYEHQLEKLKNAKASLEFISNHNVHGCLPYYGLFDNNTIKALIESGYKYVLTDSLTDRSVPKSIIRGEDQLISITKTARDDYEIIRDFGLINPDFQLYTYQEDIDRVLFEGGLYILKMHTEYQCRDEYINVVKNLIKDLKKKKYWITTANEIRKWASKKSYIELKIDKRGSRRVAVKITNPGKEEINDLIVSVDLNDDASNIVINSEIVGTKPAKYKYNKKTRQINLYISSLKKGESRTYYIDYNKPSV